MVKRKAAARKPYTAAEIKLLKQHSKEDVCIEDRKANEKTRGIPEAESVNSRNRSVIEDDRKRGVQPDFDWNEAPVSKRAKVATSGD